MLRNCDNCKSRLVDTEKEPCYSCEEECNWQLGEPTESSPCENCYFRCEEGAACCAGPMLGMPLAESDDFCQDCDKSSKEMDCENCSDLVLPGGCFVEDTLIEVIDHYESQVREYPEYEHFRVVLGRNKGYLTILKSARGVE